MSLEEAWAKLDLPDPEAVPESLIHYVLDLEALVRWFALPFRWQDPNTGEVHQGEPVWEGYNEITGYMPENERLQRTWRRVMDGST